MFIDCSKKWNDIYLLTIEKKWNNIDTFLLTVLKTKAE